MTLKFLYFLNNIVVMIMIITNYQIDILLVIIVDQSKSNSEADKDCLALGCKNHTECCSFDFIWIIVHFRGHIETT